MAERLGDMVFYRLDGDLQLLGDLLIGTTVESLKDDDPFPDRGKRLNGSIDLIGLFEKHTLGRLQHFLLNRLAMDGHHTPLGRLFFHMIDQQAARNDEDLLLQRMIIGQSVPELPKTDETLLGKIFGRVMKGNPSKEEAEYLYVQAIIDFDKRLVIAVFYSR